jgi:hypothetical protein
MTLKMPTFIPRQVRYVRESNHRVSVLLLVWVPFVYVELDEMHYTDARVRFVMHTAHLIYGWKFINWTR